MAGGKFDKLAGKTRPGTYINFQSERTDTVGTSERGTTIIPLMKPAYGPAGTYIELTNAGPDAAYAKLGFSVYDSDTNRQMLLIREAFKNASKVLIYIVKDGTKAKATNETAPTLTATAKYGGSRGNALTVTVAANPVEGFDVTVSLAGDTVAFYEGLSTVDDLIAKNCEYVTFTGLRRTDSRRRDEPHRRHGRHPAELRRHRIFGHAGGRQVQHRRHSHHRQQPAGGHQDEDQISA